MKLDLQVFTMHEIKNSVFYDYIEQYDQDTEYHFVGEIDYHLLENVARWEKPEVFGVAKKMDRSSMKSKYCTQSATEAFEQLIKDINAKYILLSYNNMAAKGNDRSNAKISDDDILRILKQKGEVKIFSESYKAFTTGKSDIDDNQERLFLCRCFN